MDIYKTEDMIQMTFGDEDWWAIILLRIIMSLLQLGGLSMVCYLPPNLWTPSVTSAEQPRGPISPTSILYSYSFRVDLENAHIIRV